MNTLMFASKAAGGGVHAGSADASRSNRQPWPLPLGWASGRSNGGLSQEWSRKVLQQMEVGLIAY